MRELEVENLLSFERLRLSLQPGLTVLVGQNDVGKSNIVRLVRLVRDAVAAHPYDARSLPRVFEDRYVRLTSPQGRVSVGIELTEERERSLMLMFFRAMAARAAEPSQNMQPRTSQEWTALRSRIAAFVESSVGDEAVGPLCEGRLVMVLDARPPSRWAMALEFDYGGESYHIGVYGRGVSTGTIVKGSLDLDRVTYTCRDPDVTEKMDPSSDTWTPITLGDFLPGDHEAVNWNVGNAAGGDLLPLTLELARVLGLAADNSRPPDIWWVLRDIVGRSLAVTANLRRPPRTLYSLDEAREGLAVEDAGDLPLELYRLKVGTPRQREAYKQLQEQFVTMTGVRLDVAAGLHRSLSTSDSDTTFLLVEPQVESASGWISIENAGAGLWEALVALAATLPEPGRIVLLDEPATHLHSTWQRLLLRHLQSIHQVLLITHSPFLVPGETVDGLQRVARLVPSASGTRAVGIKRGGTPEGWQARWRQIVASSSDARSALFTRGVILVEGETEVGAFRRWFNNTDITGSDRSGLDVENLMVLSVDGDWNFGPHISYLEAMAVAWVVLADGPALAPSYQHSLLKSFRTIDDGVEVEPLLVGDQPEPNASFEEWRRFWFGNRVTTVANSFGLTPDGKKIASGDDSGEIERYFQSLDSELWSSVKGEVTSKVRRGYLFAERLDLPNHLEATSSLRGLWEVLSAILNPAE